MPQAFFQKIEVGGNEIDLITLINGTYIETIDLTGPIIILNLKNYLGYITDELGVKSGDTIAVTVSDIEITDTMEEIVEFIITSIKPSKIDGATMIIGIEKDVWESYKKKTIFFSGDSPKSIISAIFPNLKTETSDFHVIGDYLCSSSRPVNMIKTLKGDLSAFCWASRGTVFFKKYEEILEQEPILTAEYDVPELSDNSAKILQYQNLLKNELHKEIFANQPVGFNIEDGFIQSSAYKEMPQTQTQLKTVRDLNRFALAYAPAIEMVINGRGQATPGKTIAVKIYQTYEKTERPMDESIPSKIIIGKVAHYSSKQEYLSRITGYKLITPNQN